METNRDNNFFNQVEKYEKSIQRIFNKAIDEAISRGLVREDLIRNGQFSFDNLPSTKKEADKLFKQLNNTLVDEIRKGIEFAWDSRNEKLIEYFREKGVQEDVLSVLKTRNQSAMLGFQNRKENGLRLSNRVWNITKSFKQDMEIALEVSISQGKSASRMASELKNLLQNPDALYRRVRNEQGNLVLSRQAKAFNPGQGVYRSAYKNAFRLARTETNMAYQLSANTRYNSLNFVIGQRIMLSNNPNHCDMCEAFEGDYPKEFIFRSWHPQCYDKETEVMTSNGWKLFKDVNHSDKIMSLNPETKQPEWVKWVKTFAYRHKGNVIKFHNKALDMVVTPDHRMVYINDVGRIDYLKADLYTMGDGPMLTQIDNDKEGIRIVSDFEKEILDYNNYVYDLELERNHILYVRRNGKCVWGSNCRCTSIPIIKSQFEMQRDRKRKRQGLELLPTKGVIKDIPFALRDWVIENRNKLETKPTYFFKDNKNFFN